MRAGEKICGLYAIADLEMLAARGVLVRDYAASLCDAGVATVQLRAKNLSPAETLKAATVLREILDVAQCVLVINDRADLAALARFDGVHVGQGDLGVEDARRVLERGSGARRIVGVSTHTDEQVLSAAGTSADYVAIGPVFATGTKLDAAAVVGLEGVRRARALTTKPLVAIGGITRQNAASVIAAGADSLAVISGLLVEGETVAKAARDFLDFFG